MSRKREIWGLLYLVGSEEDFLLDQWLG